jgi:putative redox protein
VPSLRGYSLPVKIRTVTLRHEGGERFVGTTGTDRSYDFGDDRHRNEYSPVESVVASLAACTGMDVISILVKKRQQVARYEVEVRAEQRTEYPQVLTTVDVLHIVEGPVVLEHAVRRAIELSATKYCPVNAMLSAGATEIHHRFRMHCTGPEEKEAEGEVVVTGPFRRPNVVE